MSIGHNGYRASASVEAVQGLGVLDEVEIPSTAPGSLVSDDELKMPGYNYDISFIKDQIQRFGGYLLDASGLAESELKSVEDFGLSSREREILGHAALGGTRGAIAKELWVEESTVRRHLSSIYRKMDVTSRTEALGLARKNRLLPVDEDNLIALAESVDLSELTEREREVLELLAEGKANKQVASILEITLGTVKFHVGNILMKTGASNRSEAIKLFSAVEDVSKMRQRKLAQAAGLASKLTELLDEVEEVEKREQRGIFK
jgi:DNA-binding NarL/FixJ family response regulator